MAWPLRKDDTHKSRSVPRADCVLASIPSLTQDIFNDHGVVACWSQAETAWDSQVTHFCGMGAT